MGKLEIVLFRPIRMCLHVGTDMAIEPQKETCPSIRGGGTLEPFDRDISDRISYQPSDEQRNVPILDSRKNHLRWLVRDRLSRLAGLTVTHAPHCLFIGFP